MLTAMHANDAVNLWRAASPESIVWAFFDEDYIAFHLPSGQTHFLNAASYHLICEMLTEARGLDWIASRFTVDEESDEHLAESLDQLRAMLEHLEELGLVDRV